LDSLAVFITKVFFGFFAIMNPIANAPIFIGLVEDFGEAQKRVIARRSVVTAFVVVAAFSLAGKLIFELFGLTLPAFRITGGILIFIVGLELLQGRLSKVQSPASASGKTARDSALRVAISPLAVPILAGPGTVATAMNFAAMGSASRVAATIGIFGLMCLITYVLFISGEKVISFLGEGVVNVISRMMGLILAVIGTEMVILGARGAFEFIR
jgi:multiple antibiotic resistance protein